MSAKFRSFVDNIWDDFPGLKLRREKEAKMFV